MSNQAEDSYCIFKLNFHELWWNLQLRLRDTKLPALLSHQHSTTVSLETYPLSSPVFNHNNGEIETTMKVLNCQGKNLSLLISFWYHSQGEFRFTTLGVTGKPRLNFSLFHYGLRNVLHNSHHSLKLDINTHVDNVFERDNCEPVIVWLVETQCGLLSFPELHGFCIHADQTST